ncbi:MAG TPA: hypothetical protein VN777_14835 [Terriglobales bacterium]|nr:hypothetical protein [Terriglobales bacterium]
MRDREDRRQDLSSRIADVNRRKRVVVDHILELLDMQSQRLPEFRQNQPQLLGVLCSYRLSTQFANSSF